MKFPLLYADHDSGTTSSLTHGRSASKALGRPDDLSNWELFVRESLQNSWDARDQLSADDGVTFAIDYELLDKNSSDILRRSVFGQGTTHVPGLNQALAKECVPLLIVSDSGTTGLRGPTNAVLAAEGPSDFNSFIREIGRSASKEVKGGSYGFGKGVFFIAGRSRTILVYTRTIDDNGTPVNRFIAVADDDSYTDAGFNYTGRHWWGERTEFKDTRDDSISIYAEPITGPQADNTAKLFKMDRYFTEERPTGTSIAVVDPAFEGPSEIHMSQIARALTRWAWPHMVYTPSGEDKLHFMVSHNGSDIQVPDPQNDPILKEFVSAYKDSLDVDLSKPEGFTFRKTTEVSSVRSNRPARGLGRIGIRELTNQSSGSNSIIGNSMNSIALMRGHRMVVEYRSGPTDRFGRQYAAVFTADDDLDGEFALSEPTTHDAWHPSTLTKQDLGSSTWTSSSNPVRIALNHMDKLIQSWGTEPTTNRDSPYDNASRQIASRLGGILSGIPGTSMSERKKPVLRADVRGVKKGADQGTPESRLVNLLPHGDELYAVFQLSMNCPKGTPPAAFNIDVQVETDTGPTRKWDELGYRPVIESWRFLREGSSLKDLRPSRHSAGDSDSDTVTLSPDHNTAILFVRQRRGLAISLKITRIRSESEVN